jgi:hypothetical protein
MPTQLITAANPGPYEQVEAHLAGGYWWLALAIPAVTFILFQLIGQAIRAIRNIKGFSLMGTGFAVLAALIIVATLGALDSRISVDANEAPRAAWNAEVAQWLDDEYGFDVDAAEVGDSERPSLMGGGGMEVVYEGKIIAIRVKTIAGYNLAVVDVDADPDQLILPVDERPAKP